MKLNRIVATGLALILGLTLSSGAAFAAAQQPATAKVNINTASVEQLTELPGVGEKLAARIVEYRQKNGPFKTADELMNVRGIGEKSFGKLQPHLTVGAPAAAKSGSR